MLLLHQTTGRIAVFLPIFFFLVCASAATAERVVLPTPPGGGPGVSLMEADNALPSHATGSFDLTEAPRTELPESLLKSLKWPDTDGGDDIVIATGETWYQPSMDIALNGDIYVATVFDDPTTGMEIRIYRSQNGGDTWTLWGELSNPLATTEYTSPSILVAEGVEDKCFVAYAYRSSGSDHQFRLAGSDISLTTGDFSTEVVVMSEVDINFDSMDIATDAGSYSSYFLYFVATAYKTGASECIWFARSTDRGVSCEAAYEIATVTAADRGYYRPAVAYGYGGYVHVAWYFSLFDGECALRYRRASSYANGGLEAWDTAQYLTSTSSGYHEKYPRIDASLTDNQVVIGINRLLDTGGEHLLVQDPGFFSSSDAGVTFPIETIDEDGSYYLDALQWQPATGNWVYSGERASVKKFHVSAGSDITSWSSGETLSDDHDVPRFSSRVGMALDPSRSWQVATAWSIYTTSGTDSLMFDAEWRDGPGYPNLEAGFPLDLAASPISPPAVVDLDDDGDLEIVFSDDSNMVQAFHHDGTPVDGWPVDVGFALSDGPVAIGDLRGDGSLMVLVGTTSGRAFAYDVTGTIVPGWPVLLYVNANTYISIGALGGPYPRMAAIAAGNISKYFNNNGVTPHDVMWGPAGEGIFTAPIAIGDVDGDGVAELVFFSGSVISAVHATELHVEIHRDVGVDISGALTLGDLDMDGDVEVIVPTINGSLFVLDDDGSNYPGTWPFVSSSGTALSAAAIADCLGGSAPEIAVAAKNWTVHLVYEDGDEQSGYPVDTASWFIYGSPIMGLLADPYSSDVIIGARGYRGWAWNNFGQVLDGWPKYFEDHVTLTPAMGDLDQDGSSEIVFLTENQLIVVDINQVPAAADDSWPMYGYNPQRTGCADCTEDIVTPVQDYEPGAITRISFAPPSPNPVGASTTFSFAVPVRAQIRLDVFNLRGERVKSVYREESGPGECAVAWHGDDDAGRRLASGQYVARLQVRGPGVDERLVRKVTLLR